MKVWLNKPIYGIEGHDENGNQIKRLHADAGNILPVILHNRTHYICDSKHYPGDHIVVFPSQVAEVISEVASTEAEDSIEKYYNVYEEPKSIIELENDLPYSTLQSDDDLMD